MYVSAGASNAGKIHSKLNLKTLRLTKTLAVAGRRASGRRGVWACWLSAVGVCMRACVWYLCVGCC